jgi:hypothetical protein
MRAPEPVDSWRERAAVVTTYAAARGETPGTPRRESHGIFMNVVGAM